MGILSGIKGWKLPAVAAIALTLAVGSVLTRKPTPGKEPLVLPPTSEFKQSIAGIGIIEPVSELVSVGSEMPGIVRQVYVKVGAHVQQGTPLFSLDDRDVNAQISTLEAALKSAQLQAKQANDQYATVKALKDSRAVSKDEFTRREYAAKVADAKVDEIRAQWRQWMTTKERLTAKAPMSGEILAVNIHPGEYALTTGGAEPLIRMGDTRVLRVRVEIDEQNASRIHKDAKAFGSPRGDTALKIPLRFVRFEPYVKPKVNLATGGQRVDTRVMQVIYELEASSTNVFVGQQMDVFIEQQATESNR
jgi:RND family efflux transporter MFP subunit